MIVFFSLYESFLTSVDPAPGRLSAGNAEQSFHHQFFAYGCCDYHAVLIGARAVERCDVVMVELFDPGELNFRRYGVSRIHGRQVFDVLPLEHGPVSRKFRTHDRRNQAAHQHAMHDRPSENPLSGELRVRVHAVIVQCQPYEIIYIFLRECFRQSRSVSDAADPLPVIFCHGIIIPKKPVKCKSRVAQKGLPHRSA